MKPECTSGFGPVGTNSPAPVDVLAVMDKYGFSCGDSSSEISEARAAVAELIDLADAAHAVRVGLDLGQLNPAHVIALRSALDKPSVRAALARCGGAP